MNKYVALAAVGTVSGCHWSDQWQHHKSQWHKPLFGMLEPAAHCPQTDLPRLSHHEAIRHLLKNFWGGIIKGWYQENHDVLPDACFGDWMEPKFQSLHDLKKKAHQDFWSVSISDVKDAGSMVVDMVYKNLDECHFEKVQDDTKAWCLENPSHCLMLEGLEERLFDNMFEILGSMFDIFKLYTRDDSCYTDIEKMAELYRFNADCGELVSTILGFDYKWDQSVQTKHIKKSEYAKKFRLAIKELREEYKHSDPLILMFPDLEPIIKMIENWIHNFVHMLKNIHMPHFNHKSFWGQPTQKHVPAHHAEPIFHHFLDLFKPHHNQHETTIQKWGEKIKMPNPHFEQQKYDFSHFHLF